CHVCVPGQLVSRLAYIAKSAMYAPPVKGKVRKAGLSAAPFLGMPGNEAGMCLGINGFTNYAPIADWGRKQLGGRIHGMAVFALCASRGCWFRGSHTSQKARYMRHPRGRSTTRF